MQICQYGNNGNPGKNYITDKKNYITENDFKNVPYQYCKGRYR